MIKYYGALVAALHTVHLFERVGAAAGALALIGYLLGFALVDGVGTVARRVAGRPPTKGAAS